jgi:hypothetical protein
MKKFAIDSFVVAISLGLGGTVGYLVGWIQLDNFRHEAAQMGFWRKGRWVQPEDIDWHNLRDRQRAFPDGSEHPVDELQLNGVACNKSDRRASGDR